MLGIKLLGFWLIAIVSLFGWRRLRMHKVHVSHVVPEFPRQRA
jgi:hypothetical protein